MAEKDTNELVCSVCRRGFQPTDKMRAVMERSEKWRPEKCAACFAKGIGPRRGAGSREENLTLSEVMDKYQDGPQDGVFTDGACEPNPGPGGWGAVFVRGGEVVRHSYGKEGNTTNNRMELTALIEGAKLVPEGEAAVLHTDSSLCSDTINKWAVNWERLGWRRNKKVGEKSEVKNLDLVKRLFFLMKSRPELKIEWIKAHDGNRWNEYADSLATAWRRKGL